MDLFVVVGGVGLVPSPSLVFCIRYNPAAVAKPWLIRWLSFVCPLWDVYVLQIPDLAGEGSCFDIWWAGYKHTRTKFIC